MFIEHFYMSPSFKHKLDNLESSENKNRYIHMCLKIVIKCNKKEEMPQKITGSVDLAWGPSLNSMIGKSFSTEMTFKLRFE